MPDSPLISVAKITGAFGVRGWVRLQSFTEPADNLFKMHPLYLVQNGNTQVLNITTYQAHKPNWVAKFAECEDRDQALAWRGADIKIPREQLPALPEGKYYWVDLEGLEVINLQKQSLGHIDHLFATGANDVMVLIKEERESYIPFVQPEIVREVNLDAKKMIVDWEQD